MNLEDVSTVAALERASFSTPWKAETFAELVRSEAGAEVWVAESGRAGDASEDSGEGGVVGYAVLWTAADQAELANLAVRPELRGRGIGGQLLAKVLARCREEGVTALYLEVRASNDVARSLYENRGFRTVGIRRNYYSNPREDARVMMKSFAADPASDGSA